MIKSILSAAACLFLSSAAICSANNHLSHFNHFSSGTFTASTPPHSSLRASATIQGTYHQASGDLTIIITADTPTALITAKNPVGEWIGVIVFNDRSGRLDLKNSFPFDNGHVATSGPYNLNSGVLLTNELIGTHAGATLRGTLRIERNNGRYTLTLHMNAGSKRYTFEYSGS